jgi:hypothetical protein
MPAARLSLDQFDGLIEASMFTIGLVGRTVNNQKLLAFLKCD